MPHVIRKPGVLGGTQMATFLALVHAVNDVLTAILGALLPTLQTRLAAGTTTLALLVAAFSISSSITQPLLGALADRYGLRKGAGLGVALGAISLSFVGVIDSVPLLLVLLVLGGLGSAALHPVSTSIVGGPSAKNPGLAVGLFTAGGMVGFAAGPILILYVISRYGSEATPWLMLPGLLLAVGVFALLPEFEPHNTGRLTHAFDRRMFTGTIGWLTATASLVSLAFITFTSAVPLWLVNAHGLSTDAPLLGGTLGFFSLGAGLGAIAGGAVGARLGYARTTAFALLAAVPALTAVLIVPPGVATLALAATAGALIYASQPLLVVAAQMAAPRNPSAAAGIVLGLGSGIAGLAYVGVGALQGRIGLAPAMTLVFALLIPAAVIAYRALALRGTDMTTTNRDGEKSPHVTSAAEPSLTSVTGWSPERLARTAGVLYLGVAVLGSWAHGYVRATVHVRGVMAAVGFLGVALFQVTLAAGAPFGRAAWGGTHPGQLPVGLRVGSAIAVGVWLLAATIVAGHAGIVATPFSPAFLQRGTWVLVALTLVGAVMNVASSSPWERFMWAPITLALAGLCYLVVREPSAI